MSTTTEIPKAQFKGPIRPGPATLAACGPCSLEALQDWEKNGKKSQVFEDPKTGVRGFSPGDPRPNIRVVPLRTLASHLREVHGVDLNGKKLRFRSRRQGCTHTFRTSQRCPRCGTTMRDIAGRVKR